MKRLMILLTCLVFALLVACSNSEDVTIDEENSSENDEVNDEEDATQELLDEMHIAIDVEAPTLDPHVSTASATGTLTSHIHETLFALDSEFNAEPFLAEDYEIANDGEEINIMLREGVTFHNGKEMIAEDVVASINRWTRLSATGRAMLENMTDIIEVDDYTVSIRLSEPSGVIIPAMASPTQALVIMPKEVLDNAGDDVVDEPIGTGPYQYVDWVHDQYIHLTRFDDYQPLETGADGFSGKKEAYVQDLYFHSVADNSTRIMGLQTGEYDYAINIDIDSIDQISEADHLEERMLEYYQFDNIHFNTAEGVFSDVRLRQAVAAALDMNELYLAALGNEDFYELDGGMVYPFDSDYVDDGTEYYNQNDTERAIQLVEEAGYGGTSVTVLASRDYEFLYRMSVVIRETLEDIGMDVDLQVYDWATLTSLREEPEQWDIFMTFWSILPDPTLKQYLDSRNDFAGWYNNPEMDRLLDGMRIEVDQNERQDLFRQIQSLYWEDNPVIKVGNRHGLDGYHNDLEVPPFFFRQTFYNVK